MRTCQWQGKFFVILLLLCPVHPNTPPHRQAAQKASSVHLCLVHVGYHLSPHAATPWVLSSTTSHYFHRQWWAGMPRICIGG